MIDVLENKELIQTDNVADALILPTPQADALELLMQGTPVKSVADTVGVSERTVYRWMSKEPFASALKKSKEVVVNNLSALATERLTEMLISDNLYAQQYAISQWVKMQKDTVKVEVQKEKEYDSLEDLLADFNKK